MSETVSSPNSSCVRTHNFVDFLAEREQIKNKHQITPQPVDEAAYSNMNPPAGLTKTAT